MAKAKPVKKVPLTLAYLDKRIDTVVASLQTQIDMLSNRQAELRAMMEGKMDKPKGGFGLGSMGQ